MTTPAAPLAEYDTDGPARIELDLDFGAVHLVTGPGSTTRVTVRPSTPSRRVDTELAAATRVDLVGGVVSVAVPRRRVLGSLWRPGAIDVEIQAPAGSSVRAGTGYASFVAEGPLGSCQLRTSYGDVRIGEVGDLQVKTSGGQVSAGVVHGRSEITDAYGSIRIGRAEGTGALVNSAGDIWVGTCLGELEIRSAYGQVTVDSAPRGSVSVVTSYGATEVGVPPGVNVMADVQTRNGRVVNALTPGAPPPEAAPVLALRVRSGWGDVVIRRPVTTLTSAGEGDLP